MILPSDYFITEITNDIIDGGGNPGTTSMFVETSGSYIALEDIVEMNVAINTRLWNYPKDAPFTSVAQLQAASPWGAAVQGLWTCPEYPLPPTDISGNEPSQFGCTQQTAF